MRNTHRSSITVISMNFELMKKKIFYTSWKDVGNLFTEEKCRAIPAPRKKVRSAIGEGMNGRTDSAGRNLRRPSVRPSVRPSSALVTDQGQTAKALNLLFQWTKQLKGFSSGKTLLC